jgi:hypothetical protein
MNASGNDTNGASWSLKIHLCTVLTNFSIPSSHIPLQYNISLLYLLFINHINTIQESLLLIVLMNIFDGSISMKLCYPYGEGITCVCDGAGRIYKCFPELGKENYGFICRLYIRLKSKGLRVYRVPGFLSSRPNWAPHIPSHP